MKTKKEIRRVIPNHPNYEASNLGNIYRIGNDTPRIPSRDRGGYYRLQLDGSTRKVHQLVLEAFVCEKPTGMQCRHLDGNPQNNCVENLRWGTALDNANDFAKLNNRYQRSKITLDTVRKIKTKLQTGSYTKTAIALMFGTSRTTVSGIAHCTRYASV